MRTLFCLAAALALTGCITIGGSANKDAASTNIYTLKPAAEMHAAPARAPARGRTVVVVPKPQLPAGFDTERIALLFEQDRRLDYYADAKWSARLDDLLQDFVVSRAQDELPGKVVGTPELTPSPKYRIALTFTDIQPVYAGMADKAPRLDAAVTVSIVTVPGNAVKTQFKVQKSAPASANTLTAITNEMGKLLQTLTDEALQKAAPFLG